MAMYVILSKLSPDAFEDPKEFRKLAENVASRIPTMPERNLEAELRDSGPVRHGGHRGVKRP